MNSALLVRSVEALIPCEDLAELASKVAGLAQDWWDTPEVLVLLRSGGFEFGAGATSSGLRAFAEKLLSVEATSGVSGAGGQLAAVLHAKSPDLHGVVVVMPADPENVEAGELLGALAEIAARCGSQIQSRSLASRAVQDTRILVTRGLHDLCTSLNVLRLGMHLLEPTLDGKDPSIVQRTHRAVDKMARLIETMSEAINSEQLIASLDGTSVAPKTVSP